MVNVGKYTIHGWRYGYPIQDIVVMGCLGNFWKVLVASHRTLHSEKGHLVGGFNPSEKIFQTTTIVYLKSCLDPEHVFVPR